MFTWILSHLFGSNWKETLTNTFSIGADEFFAGQGTVTKNQVEAWMTGHVTTVASDIAKGNPLEAALLAGAAETFIPTIADGVYNYVVQHAVGTQQGQAIEQQSGENDPGNDQAAQV